MIIRTGQDLQQARKRLGWSLNEMAMALRFQGGDGPRAWNHAGARLKAIEEGRRELTGPVSVAVEAFLAGFVPAHIHQEQES